MAIILSLFILCLGLYFLSLFFQVARLEKVMTESVNLLETYMIAKYSLGDKKKLAPEGATVILPVSPASSKPDKPA